MTYAKLFSLILDSTVWTQESKETRLVWITMLAMKDALHVVRSSVPGLAKRAGVSLDECVLALERLSQPDKWSNTKDEEGRRIVKVDGGWKVVNGEKYQQMLSLEERKAYKKEWIRAKREAMKLVKKDAETEARTETVSEAIDNATNKSSQ